MLSTAASAAEAAHFAGLVGTTKVVPFPSRALPGS